jgi:hypothetical protein
MTWDDICGRTYNGRHSPAGINPAAHRGTVMAAPIKPGHKAIHAYYEAL